jgi:hypothetical protein
MIVSGGGGGGLGSGRWINNTGHYFQSGHNVGSFLAMHVMCAKFLENDSTGGNF